MQFDVIVAALEDKIFQQTVVTLLNAMLAMSQQKVGDANAAHLDELLPVSAVAGARRIRRMPSGLLTSAS